jgi:hypothetical protein
VEQESAEARRDGAIVQPRHVGLDRNHYQHADDQRQQQAQRAFQGKTGGLFDVAAQKTHRQPRDQKQQFHPPAIDEQHRVLQPRCRVLAVQRHAPPVGHRRHVEHAGVIENQQAKGEHAKNVDIVAANHAGIPLKGAVMLVRHGAAVLRQVTDRRRLVTNGGPGGTNPEGVGGVAL